ncbi:MAG: MATE family efflux transporter, partial [Bacteroidota bacterium]
ESLVGLHYGARDFQMVDVAVKRSFQWGLGLALFFGLLFLGLGNEVAELYTDDPEVLATIRKYMWSLSALPLLAFGCYIWDGIFIGYGASREMRDAMLLSLICYVVLFTIFREFTTWAIWISFMIFLALRGVLQTVYYARSIQPRLWE